MCTPYFEIQRGVRQGDPLVAGAEILAIAIRSRTDIQGFKIGQEVFKIVQCADDLTVFVPNLERVQRIFHLLDQFETCSGLKVNYTKTEAMWIGSYRYNTAAPLGLKWVNTVEALEKVFHIMKLNNCRKFFITIKLKDIRLQTRLWRCGPALLNHETPKRNTETPKQRNETSKHRNSETPKQRNTETAKHRNSEAPKQRSTETAKHRNSEAAKRPKR